MKLLNRLIVTWMCLHWKYKASCGSPDSEGHLLRLDEKRTDVIRALETMNLSVSKLNETTKDTEWDKCVFVRKPMSCIRTLGITGTSGNGSLKGSSDQRKQTVAVMRT